MSQLAAMLGDYTVRNVLAGSAVIGVTGGVLGTFAVLRRRALLGDALAHASLPGICAAFLLLETKATVVLLAGATLAAWAAMGLIVAAVRRVRLDVGSAMAVVLTTSFGLGVVLLTVAQKRPDSQQAGLDKFLFGQAAALVAEDVVAMGLLGAAAILTVVAFFKQFKVASFDAQLGETLGLRPNAFMAVQDALLVVAVVVALKTVGVVLASALLVAPAVAARQWVGGLAKMLLLAGLFGAGAGVAGAWASIVEPGVPTGPAIVLALAATVGVSLLVAPHRGLLWARARRNA